MTIVQVTCSLPTNTTNFVYISGPDYRSTFNILWSCVTVLILCTWTILHLNVPIQSTPKTWRQTLSKSIYMAWRKVSWMAVTLITPELILGKAVCDRLAARYLRSAYKKIADEDGVEWTIAHTFLANMGGFVIVFPEEFDRVPECLPPASEDSQTVPPPHDRRQRPSPAFSDGDIGQSHTETRHDAIVRVGTEMNTNVHHDVQEAGRTTGVNTGFQKKVPARRLTTFEYDPRNLFLLPSTLPVQNFTSKLEAMVQANKRLAQFIGETNWHVSAQNREIVMQTFLIENRGARTWDDLKNARDVYICLQGHTWAVDAPQLLACRNLGLIKALPKISADEIDDRNKGDFVIKAWSLAQVSWLIVQLVMRAARKLPVSQLEIVVLAFAVCSSFTYVLLWEMPKDVKTPIYLQATRPSCPADIIIVTNQCPALVFSKQLTHWMRTMTIHDWAGKTDVPMAPFYVGSALGAAVFGVLHCVAWNFSFPSNLERLLWRIGSIATIATPVFIVLPHELMKVILGPDCPNIDRFVVKQWANIACVVVYVVARLYITAEAFRLLAYLEPGAYKTTWADIFPHIG